MALVTVADFIRYARTLLQDTYDAPEAPFRYSDSELVDALNMGLLEARRVRPDLLLGHLNFDIPQYTASNLAATVDIDQMYRSALVYYMAGMAQLRDNEDTPDARATVFLNKFLAQLQVVQA